MKMMFNMGIISFMLLCISSCEVIPNTKIASDKSFCGMQFGTYKASFVNDVADQVSFYLMLKKDEITVVFGTESRIFKPVMKNIKCSKNVIEAAFDDNWDLHGMLKLEPEAEDSINIVFSDIYASTNATSNLGYYYPISINATLDQK